jgi:predicted nucleic acid-binding protein
MTVVVDSNVFISALVYGGNPRRVLARAEAGDFGLALSAAIREETEGILKEKFGWPLSASLKVASRCGASRTGWNRGSS